MGIEHEKADSLRNRLLSIFGSGDRYEQRSLLITANQPFGEWGKIFPDPAMTLAAVDRLVHHATLFELNVDSYRRRTDMDNKRSQGRPATCATIKTSHLVSPSDNDATNTPCPPGEAG